MPVCLLGRQPQALAVHPSLTTVNSVADLVALVKQKPGMGCATSGSAQSTRAAGMVRRQAGIRLEHVPYRGAGKPSTILSPGTCRSPSWARTALIPHYKARTVRLLAQSGETRSASMPDVPTLLESGFAGLTLESWYAALCRLARRRR